MSLSRPRLIVSSLVVGVLWLVVACIDGALRQIVGGLGQAAIVVPDVVPPGVWIWPGVWPAVAVTIGAIAVAACHALYSGLAARGAGASVVVSTWFAAVAAAATVGLAMDLAASWDPLLDYGLRGLVVGAPGATAAAGALWGLVVGWAPGLVAARPARSTASSPVDRAWLFGAAAVAVVTVVVAGVAGGEASRADIAAQAEAAWQAQVGTGHGSPPDPDAEGDPVPTAVPGPAELDPQWCTADKAAVLKGEPDAATGHRGMPITLMNFSTSPCVIEGYPDVAFGDQNGHLLAVSIEHSGSFMAQDPGPQRIEVPPGGSAITFLGWDAASTHSGLVTSTVYAAPTPGMERGSWPIDLDIVEGSTVEVTAWQLAPDPVTQ